MVRRISRRPLNTARALERRQQLLDVAFELFADHDYDEISVDAIAERAGVSHGLVFQHFQSKKGIYVAGVRMVLEEFNRRVAPDPELEPFERLQCSLAAYVDYAAEHPRGYRSLMSASFSEVQELVERSRWEGVARLAEGLGLPGDDPAVRVALRGWTSNIEGALLAWLDHQELERERLIDLLSGSLLGTAQALAAGTT